MKDFFEFVNFEQNQQLMKKAYETTVKPALSSDSKIGKTKTLMTNCSLMKVKSIAECSMLMEHSAILLTCIKR